MVSKLQQGYIELLSKYDWSIYLTTTFSKSHIPIKMKNIPRKYNIKSQYLHDLCEEILYKEFWKQLWEEDTLNDLEKRKNFDKDFRHDFYCNKYFPSITAHWLKIDELESIRIYKKFLKRLEQSIKDKYKKDFRISYFVFPECKQNKIVHLHSLISGINLDMINKNKIKDIAMKCGFGFENDINDITNCNEEELYRIKSYISKEDKGLEFADWRIQTSSRMV